MFAIAYSMVSYAFFLGVFTYFALFSDGVLVPRSVDVAIEAPLTWALTLDLGLISLFGIQHSVMARSGFKKSLTRLLPAHVERATYVLVSSLALALLMWQWRPIEGALWSVQDQRVAIALWLVNALGWLGVPIASFMIDHFDLFGIKQTLHHFRRTSMARTGFVTPLLYRYVRHPMMSSLLIGLWVTPHMSWGHLLLSLGMTAYVVIGVHFEERALMRELGVDYERYRATTPKFLPLGTSALADEGTPQRPAPS
ncbi:MAG: NnrU protein [Myxococcaceae bacterium]|nr:NnrU protein [Myxococcaceae bacterium]